MSFLDNCRNNVINSLAGMTQHHVAKLRGDSCIRSIGTTLEAKTNDEVHTLVVVDKLDAKCLIVTFIFQRPSIMNRLCKVIFFCLSNLLV